jgi:hypothetical protein
LGLKNDRSVDAMGNRISDDDGGDTMSAISSTCANRKSIFEIKRRTNAKKARRSHRSVYSASRREPAWRSAAGQRERQRIYVSVSIST